MPLLSKRTYTKREPYRDARLFIIVCEGDHTEPEYFDYFDRLSQQIKVTVVPSEDGKSSPNHLTINAEKAVAEIIDDGGDYNLWIVMDLDKWHAQGHIPAIVQSCKDNKWNLAISNPCFEVWLNFHFSDVGPTDKINISKTWKRYLGETYGGFDHTQHPGLLETAIKNAKANYSETGYIPDVGSTQVYRLGEEIWELVKKVLNA